MRNPENGSIVNRIAASIVSVLPENRADAIEALELARVIMDVMPENGDGRKPAPEAQRLTLLSGTHLPASAEVRKRLPARRRDISSLG